MKKINPKHQYTDSILIFNDENDQFPAHCEKVIFVGDNVIFSSNFYTPLSGDSNLFHREWDQYIQQVFKRVHGTRLERISDNGKSTSKFTYLYMS